MLRNVVFRGVLGMFRRVHMVAVSGVGVMPRCLVLPGLMMLGCFLVVARSVLMVLRCLGVMLGCFF